MNYKKIFLSTVPALLLSGAAFLSFKIWYNLKEKDKIKTETQNLPAIQLRKTDGTILNIVNFKNTKELLVLNYFNPDCGHCQSMVQELFLEQKHLENVNWLMISSAPVDKTKQFADSMQIAKLNSVTVLNDTASVFLNTFGIVSVPSYYVYKNGKMLRKHSGQCSVTYLLKE